MRFYNHNHRFYCGIDLHARLLAICQLPFAICILDQAGTIVLQTQIPADKKMLLDILAPFRPDVVVAVECLFAWYWVAELCQAEKIPFVLSCRTRGYFSWDKFKALLGRYPLPAAVVVHSVYRAAANP